MSDQTPDTTQDVTDGNEPSMEDILASIRKIIADDDTHDVKVDAVGTVASQEPNDTPSDILKPILGQETPEAAPSEILGLQPMPADDVSDLEIDAMLDGIGGENTSLLADNAVDSDLEITLPDMAAPEISMPDIAEDDSVLDLAIPMLKDEPVEALAQEISAVSELEDVPSLELEDVAAPVSAEMDDDLSLMLDNLIVEDSPADPLADIAQAPEVLEPEVLEPEVLEVEAPLEMDELAQALEEDFIGDDILEDVLDDAPEDLDFTPSQGDSDMELVKSLMADLTEKPFPIEELDVELDDVQDELPEGEMLETEIAGIEPSIAVPDEDVELQESLDALISEDDVDDDSTDMMDEILNMTLYDEANLQENTIAAETELASEPEGGDISDLDISELDISELEIPAPEQDDAPALSLQDIANAAQSDATTLEGGSGLAGLGAGLAIGTAAGALSLPNTESHDAPIDTVSALQTPDDVDSLLSRLDNIIETPEDDLDETLSDINLEDDLAETIERPNPATLNEETPQMPRAAKSETIIDEVTETAAAGAFASLNQAVEEKATVAERGDRIGDLVMESLRPMLKEWLDANLKGIVERAVTKEVKRISSGK